jgi:radical SAM protein with 4Fe4S-binding SPASM domain
VEGARILGRVGFPFIVQTTAGAHNRGELEELAELAWSELGARVWNLYFLVPSGRGQFVSDLTPEDYDEVLTALRRIQRRYQGRMVVNAKCAPHSVRQLLEEDPSSPFFRSFAGGAGGCPAGTHYLGIRPNGDVTPCPYLPLFGGNLKHERLVDVWNDSELFRTIRSRNRLGGRCGDCELSGYCGGCRARAHGMTGDLLAEDPLCTHRPGTFPVERLPAAPALEYGLNERADEDGAGEVSWDPAARERMTRIPAFVRGMVVAAVERRCREQGIGLVTVARLEDIRSRMPTPKIFGRSGPDS